MKKWIALFIAGMLVGLIISSILLSRSQSEEPVLDSSAELSAHSTTKPDVLTIKDNGTIIDLPIHSIPQYEAYLASQEDSKFELERTQYERIDTPSQDHYIMLKYGCGNKQCSTSLLKVSDSGINSIEIGQGIFQDYKLSPDAANLLLRYAYNEGGKVVRHLIIPINLEKMKRLAFTTEEETTEFSYEPTWPILEYEWVDHTQIQIITADINPSDFTAMQKWHASDAKRARKVELTIVADYRS